LNNNIVPIIARTDDGELRISSEQIAEGAGVQHKNVLELVAVHAASLERFGHLAFQTRDGYQGHKVRVGLLNEQQATLLMTFMRNSEQVVAFKVALVEAFYKMAQTLQPSVPRTYAEALRAAADAAEAIEQKNQVIALLEPKAASWDSIVSSEGSWSYNDAAKVLHESGQINIGEKRLVAWLVESGFLYRDVKGRPHAYQQFIERGLFVAKARTYTDYKTGIEMASSAPQVRITGKGLDLIRTRLLPQKEVSA
jgi:anti-repressor protein